MSVVLLSKIADTVTGLDVIGSSGAGTLSIPTGMLIFYLSIAGNFAGELFNHRIQAFFNNNYWAKHIIGFMILLFTITFASGITDFGKMMGVTIALYMWFTLLNKMPPPWTFGILIMLFALFMLNNYKSKLDKEEHADKIKKINKWTGILFSLAMFATLIGAGFKLSREIKQHGKKFSILRFLFGARGGHVVFPRGEPPAPDHSQWWTWEKTLTYKGGQPPHLYGHTHGCGCGNN